MKDPAMSFHSLRLDNLSLYVKLGCTAEERTFPQEIRMSVEFRFKSPPKGAFTDQLEDTVCYSAASEALRQHCESGEFKLIERIAHECEVILRKLVGDKATIGLAVHKVRPPVPSLLGGATYRCGDFLL